MQKGLDPKKKQPKEQLHYWLWYLMTKRECLIQDYMAHKDMKTLIYEKPFLYTEHP